MGFGRRNGRRDDHYHKPRKKMGLGKKIKLLGVILAFVGLAIFALNQGAQNQIFIISLALVIIGIIMIAGKRILDPPPPPPCNCCKCTNCGSDHNHWTHDRRY